MSPHSPTCRGHFLLLFFKLSLYSSVLTSLFYFTVFHTAENRRPLICHHLIFQTQKGLPVVGSKSALQKGMSDQDVYALKGISFLCTMPDDAAWLQWCMHDHGFSLSIAGQGRKSVTSNSAERCCCTTFQEQLCLKEETDLVLESLTCLFLLYNDWTSF